MSHILHEILSEEKPQSEQPRLSLCPVSTEVTTNWISPLNSYTAHLISNRIETDCLGKSPMPNPIPNAQSPMPNPQLNVQTNL